MRLGRLDANTRVETIGGPEHRPVVGAYEPCGDGRLRPRPAIEKPSLHQQAVGTRPILTRHVSRPMVSTVGQQLRDLAGLSKGTRLHPSTPRGLTRRG